MTQNRINSRNISRDRPDQSFYALLGLSPAASTLQIRRAYRELSKRYHPDTTDLPPEIAKQKFQQLNEAYATLMNPELRLVYDQRIGYSRLPVVRPTTDLDRPLNSRRLEHSFSSAYLDPTDRPLSAGEIFALFLLGFTFIGCLVLAIAIGLTRGDVLLQTLDPQNSLANPPLTLQKVESSQAQLNVPSLIPEWKLPTISR